MQVKICAGCEEDVGTHTHPSVQGSYCESCADLFLPIAEPEEPDPESPDYYIMTEGRNHNSYGPGRP
jgi:hypothetical protein